MRLTLTIITLLAGQVVFGQVTHKRLLENKNFKWLTDSSSQEVTIYYQPGSWVDNNIEAVRQKVESHFNAVKSFVDIKAYTKRIHLFVVDSRAQMKLLIDRQTNGSAFHDINTVTGIASKTVNSIYSNHELFHVVAMNIWGVPRTWINEGMAVYSDNNWHGHDLHQLANYLIDNERYISINKLMKRFRLTDNLTSYPLIGSFVKYLDEVYGRDTVIKIWASHAKSPAKIVGKSTKELETEWLATVRSADYQDIKY